MQMGIEDVLETPSLSFCVDYLDIINRTEASKFGLKTEASVEDYVREQKMLNMKQIFEMTPGINDTIQSCKILEKNSSRIRIINDPEACNELFIIRKFYMQFFICYDFVVKHSRVYRLSKSSQAMNYIRLVYEIILDKSLDQANEITSIIHMFSKGLWLPMHSRHYSKTNYRFRDLTQHKINFNIFLVTHSLIKMHLKEPPYDTRCSLHYGRFSCVRRCIKNGLKPLKKVPYSELTAESELTQIGEFYPLSSENMEDPAFETIYRSIEAACDGKCNQISCNSAFTRTTMSAFLDSRYNFSSRIRVESPESPTMQMISLVNFTPMQMIIYICSCFGIWFGISIVSLNPICLTELYRQFPRLSQENRIVPFYSQQNNRRTILTSPIIQ
jgi:hypothetical protein